MGRKETNMNEKNTELMDAILSGEDDPILPDGWQEGDDLFAEVSGDADSFVTDGSQEMTELPAENEDGNPEEPDPTTVEQPEGESHSGETEEEIQEPDGEPEPQTQSRKLKLKVNHREEEIDISAMSDEDLVALLQKGRAFDQRLEQENKQKYRQTYQEQIDAGMTEAAARMVAQNEAGGKTYSLTDEEPAANPTPAPEVKEPEVRDFRAEVEQLKALYPDIKEIPDEVARAAAKGIPVLNAYLAYRDKQSTQTAASLKKENQVLKQNAASAAKAPVKGVSGGGVAPKKVDNFLKGFDSDPW
jgi:hypothetical protein